MAQSPVVPGGSNSRIVACAPSTFSCVNDLGHKPVTLQTCQQDAKQPGGEVKRKQCLWFSEDYGEPIFAMHSNCYINSECFIIDTGISVLRILPTYQLRLSKECIHIIAEDANPKFSFQFKDGSDSFAVWIQICSFQKVEPFSTNTVQLTKPSSIVPRESHLLRSSAGPTPASSWLTMKFKATSTTANKSSNWFTFAKMQVLSMSFKKSRYLLILLKSDDPDDEAPPGLFCIRTGVICLKTGSQLYYEPCESTGRKYILDFDDEALCDHIWRITKMVTPRNYDFGNDNDPTEGMTEKEKKHFNSLEIKRNQRLKLIHRCFGQLHQEVKQIMKSSKKSLQEMIDLPEIQINELFFSQKVWLDRWSNFSNNKEVNSIKVNKVKKQILGSFRLQSTHVKLHVDMVKMLMKERVPAELIAEYREALVRKIECTNYKKEPGHCLSIHCLFN